MAAKQKTDPFPVRNVVTVAVNVFKALHTLITLDPRLEHHRRMPPGSERCSDLYAVVHVFKTHFDRRVAWPSDAFNLRQ